MKRYVRCASRTGGQDPAYRENVANNPSTPADILAELANDEYEDVRTAVASNPNTPANVLRQLAGDQETYVRYNVADNPNTPADALAELADDKDDKIWNIRTRVAENPNTPVNVLRQLAKDTRYVRMNVAKNTNTPDDVLRQLANDGEWTVRCKVANNPNTPADVLSQLADDTELYVRIYVENNPNTPEDIRKRLSAGTPSASSKPKAMTWKRLVADLEAEAVDGIDSIYEQTKAGEALEGVCAEVENRMGVWLEPSIQGGQGSIDILDSDDDTRLGTLDFRDYTYEVCNMAASCSSKSSFKQQYAEYLDSHMDH